MSSYKHRFIRNSSNASDQQKQILVISIWSLWFRRNKLVHEGVKPSLQELVGFIQGYGSDLSINQEISSPSPRSMAKEVWRPPVAGVFKLNFDAAFQHDLQLAVIAVIARDSEGEIVGAETYLFLNVSDACLAEARACERVLLFTVERGYWRLFIEGDYICAPTGEEDDTHAGDGRTAKTDFRCLGRWSTSRCEGNDADGSSEAS